jgi:hypothetical protein
MNRIAIGPEGRFCFGGENFVVGGHVPPKDRRTSTSEAFTIAKNEPYLRIYEDLASALSPRSILELGIFQGGSYVLLDKLLNPHRMSAVDISGQPVAPLLQYVADKEGRFVHFSTSQSDRKILEQYLKRFWYVAVRMSYRKVSIEFLRFSAENLVLGAKWQTR